MNVNEISGILDEYLQNNNIQREEFKLEFEKGDKDYRKKNKKEIDKFLDEKLGELEISKEIQILNKDDSLVSYDFDCLYPSAQIVINSTGRK